MKYFKELTAVQQADVLNKLVPPDEGDTLNMFIPPRHARKEATRAHLENSNVCMFDEKLNMYVYAGNV